MAADDALCRYHPAAERAHHRIVARFLRDGRHGFPLRAHQRDGEGGCRRTLSRTENDVRRGCGTPAGIDGRITLLANGGGSAMKLIRFLCLLIAVALMFGVGFGYGRWYSTRPAPQKGRKILYYVDPMHTWYKSDRPGVAPDCNMPLEP